MKLNQRSHQSNSIDILNDDILTRIFDYLHLDEKVRLRRTCHRWKLLLDFQLDQLKALRLGQFQQGGYTVTSGLYMHCQHRQVQHRRYTGTICDPQVLSFPADQETHCFSINQYDYLHRALKLSQDSITMLSLGRINVSYRLLIVLTHNLRNLEHLELINCSSAFHDDNNIKHNNNNNCRQIRDVKKKLLNSSREPELIPSVESFNSREEKSIYSLHLFNQSDNEQLNMEERLARWSLVKNCQLVKDCKANKHWRKLKHLLVKDCNLLNEFSLCLILAITSQTLENLVLESNQYLTGEFLNYCGPQLKELKVNYCPLLQAKFLDQFVKLKQLLAQNISSRPSLGYLLKSNVDSFASE